MDIPPGMALVEIFFRNIGQVFLLGSWFSGAIILAGVFIASVPAGIAVIAGSLIATGVSIGMVAGPGLVRPGLYGFSLVLTALAVGVVFLRPSLRVALYAGLASIVTVFVRGARDVIVAPAGVPSFTAPFVLTMDLSLAPWGAASASSRGGPRRRHDDARLRARAPQNRVFRRHPLKACGRSLGWSRCRACHRRVPSPRVVR